MRASAARRGQVLGLLCLSGVGAELLAAYGDSTGDPAGVAFALVFFSALYGAPALLVRDLVRRRGGGWPSLLLLFAALGVVQACLIDQSMFSDDYEDYAGWEETRAATLIPALGISAHNAFNFVVGHMIYSFAAPVAVAEAWLPERAHLPWLGRLGTVVAAVAYLGVAALIMADPESQSGSTAQLVASVGVVAVLVGAAVVAARGPRAARSAWSSDTAGPSAPSVAKVLLTTTVGALVASLGPETWLGLALGVVATAAVGLGVLVASRRPGWSIRHAAAVGLGFLLARGLLAFAYYPLAGSVTAGPKYAHNLVMLGLVGWAGWVALRPPRATRAESV